MTRTWLAWLFLGACLLGCTAPLTMRFDVAAIPRSNRLEGVRIAIDEVADLRRDASQVGEVHDFPFVWDVESERQPSAVVHSLMEHMLLARGAEVVGKPEHADYFVRVDIVQLDFLADLGLVWGTETDVVLEVALFCAETSELLFRDRFTAGRWEGDIESQMLSDGVMRALDDALKRIDDQASPRDA